MQKEEKQLETSLETLIQRVTELKNSIGGFILKLEHEPLSWPSVLDNFALLSGQLNSLGRLMKDDKVPPLRNQLLLPLELSPEPDDNLRKITEGRVHTFNHDVVPNYLRTKPLPEVEEKTTQLTTKSQTVTQEMAQKQLNNLSRVTSNLLDIINSAREEWENDSSQKNNQLQASTDTNNLVATALFGKNLKMVRGRMSESPSIQQQQQQQQQQKMQNAVNKAPSTIKTQIKSATSGHPYQRP